MSSFIADEDETQLLRQPLKETHLPPRRPRTKFQPAKPTLASPSSPNPLASEPLEFEVIPAEGTTSDIKSHRRNPINDPLPIRAGKARILTTTASGSTP